MKKIKRNLVFLMVVPFFIYSAEQHAKRTNYSNGPLKDSLNLFSGKSATSEADVKNVTSENMQLLHKRFALQQNITVSQGEIIASQGERIALLENTIRELTKKVQEHQNCIAKLKYFLQNFQSTRSQQNQLYSNQGLANQQAGNLVQGDVQNFQSTRSQQNQLYSNQSLTNQQAGALAQRCFQNSQSTGSQLTRSQPTRSSSNKDLTGQKLFTN